MVFEASLRARLAFCSPSAAITLEVILEIFSIFRQLFFTFARASLAASASAAMARWSWTGSRTSFLFIFYYQSTNIDIR